LNVRIRKAGMADLPALMSLEDGAFGPRGWSEEFVKDRMEEPNVCTLVVDDERILGYIMFSIDVPYETTEVLSLAVSPSCRRRGLGRALMQNAEVVADESGARTIALCVRPDNRTAINLYLSLGYNVLALCTGYYEDGTDAYMMVKHLEDLG